MAGLMTEVDPAEWPLQAAIAEATGGELKPFDQYQGPYVLVPSADGRPGLTTGPPPYGRPVRGPLGGARLWVSMNVHPAAEGLACVYREDTEESSPPFWIWDADAAETAASFALDLLDETP